MVVSRERAPNLYGAIIAGKYERQMSGGRARADSAKKKIAVSL